MILLKLYRICTFVVILRISTGQSKTACSPREFVCDSGKCLQQNLVCDKIRDCPNGEDEDLNVCRNITSSCWSWQQRCGEDGRCKANSFQCDNGKCIGIEDGCNRIDDCGDGSDERRGLIGFKCVFINGTDLCNLPARLINDGIVHCEKQLDEYETNVIATAFECFDKSTNISIRQQCNGVIDCPDLSDECPCEDQARDDDPSHICSRYCSPLNTRVPKDCTPKTISCDGGRYEVDTDKICDGARNCADGLDERFCAYSSNYTTLHEEISCIGNIYGTENITAKLCDSIPECFDLSDECNCSENYPTFCKLRSKLTSHGYHHYICNNSDGGSYSLTVQDMCNGYWSPCSPRLVDEESGCGDRLYCKDEGGQQSIANILMCDGFKQCDDGSDEDDCTNRYQCEEGPPFSVPLNYVSDGISDCADASDECPYDLDDKIVSSRKEMINDNFLRVWVWLIGFSVLFANAYVVFITCKQLRETWSTSTNVGKGNLILIANLATADFIMGIYLIAVAVISQIYSGKYCQHDLSWRSHLHCSLLGSLSVISSQVSIFMLMTLATTRLITILNPIRSRNFRIRWIFLCVILEWAAGFVIAFLPMSSFLMDTFTISAWIPSKFNKNANIRLERVLSFLRRLETFSEREHSISTFEENTTFDSWTEIQNYLSSNNEIQTTIMGRFAYYSRHAICVPDFYLKTTDEGWQLPATIIIFNFLSFIYLPVIYFVIYRKTSKTKISSTAVDRSSQMQRKMLKLVVSDFLCWMPICLLSLLNNYGAISYIPPVMYANTAIVILPINSVLNPLLYTDTFEKLWRQLRKLIAWLLKKMTCNQRAVLQITPEYTTNTGKSQPPEHVEMESKAS